MSAFLCISLILFALCPTFVSAAEVESSIEYKYYSVKEPDKNKVADKAFKLTPLKTDGTRYLGLASYNIKYKYDYDYNDGICFLTKHEVSSPCVITLPRFTGGDEALQKRLDLYVNKLREHELAHCRIAVDYANKFSQSLDHFGRYKCSVFEKELKKTYSKIWDDCMEEQRKFDALGDHEQVHGAHILRLLAE